MINKNIKVGILRHLNILAVKHLDAKKGIIALNIAFIKRLQRSSRGVRLKPYLTPSDIMNASQILSHDLEQPELNIINNLGLRFGNVRILTNTSEPDNT